MFHAVVLYQCTNTVIRAAWFQISFKFCTRRPVSQGFKILKPLGAVNSHKLKTKQQLHLQLYLTCTLSRWKQKTWLLVTLWKSSSVTGEWLLCILFRIFLCFCVYFGDSCYVMLPCFSHFTDQTVDVKYWIGKNMFSIDKSVYDKT